MVTNEIVEIYVDLLNDWLELLLRENARSFFFEWLSDHTQTQILCGDMQKLTEWLLTIQDPRKLCSEILVIHSEILWCSNIRRTREFERTSMRLPLKGNFYS